MWKNKGFTLIEMLVIIAIIGVLSVSYIQFGKRYIQNSRNATRTEIVSQYIGAFKRVLVLNDHKFFANDPTLNPTYAAVCLGEYENDTCWVNNYEHQVDHNLNNKIQVHLDNLPTILTDGVKFEGVLYHCLPDEPGSEFCSSNLSIYWFMEDLENETSSCSPGWTIEEYNEIYDGSLDGITFCTYTLGTDGNISLSGATDSDGNWSPWSQCTAECDNEEGTQFRTRVCQNTAHGFDAVCPDGGGIYEEQDCFGATVCAGLDCGTHLNGSSWNQTETCISGYTQEFEYEGSSSGQQVDVPVYGERSRLNTCSSGDTLSSSWGTCE